MYWTRRIRILLEYEVVVILQVLLLLLFILRKNKVLFLANTICVRPARERQFRRPTFGQVNASAWLLATRVAYFCYSL